jgi:predicted phage terminase large subunit-like protein
MQPSDAARILLRRRRMRDSLTAFAQSIQIPGAPVGGDDSELFAPVGTGMAAHHVLMCERIQSAIEQDYGRLMLFLPPGSAKSTYGSAIAPTWAMGRKPGFQVILASYNTELAKKHGRKARAICRQGVVGDAFETGLSKATSAAEMWALDNGSEYMAGGLLSGLTGNRADLLIIDDPIRGRQDADSPAVRAAVWAAIEEDAMTRLKPRGSIILIQTRWHPLDPAGMLLGEKYDGRSGPWVATDGMTWEVLNIPAECEHEDDPLGRQVGEMLWPEWFDATHWKPHRAKPRSWASLFQQRPTLGEGGAFKREWVRWYEPGTEPKALNIYGASDWGSPSESSDDPDFTEHGVAGLDEEGDVWLLDWWYEQGATTDKGARAWLNMVKKWKPRGLRKWWNEKGVIYNAVVPWVKGLMKRARIRLTLDALPSTANKVSRAETFFAMCESDQVHFPDVPWAHRLVDQLCAFPVVAHDDGVDVCSLFGRALDGLAWAYVAPEEKEEEITPFSVKWLEWSEIVTDNTGRTR